MYGENFDKELNGKLEKITIDFEDIKYSQKLESLSSHLRPSHLKHIFDQDTYK